MPEWLAPSPDGTLVSVRVIPRARRSTLDGVRAGSLLVRLASPPVDGAANDALLALLARLLDTPRRSVRIARGERSRDKQVLVEGRDPSDVARRLQPLLAPASA
jgi:uncharacterized protein (TIGR00251 family)